MRSVSLRRIVIGIRRIRSIRGLSRPVLEDKWLWDLGMVKKSSERVRSGGKMDGQGN